MYCTNCGKEVKDEWAVCPKCGAKLINHLDTKKDVATIENIEGIQKKLSFHKKKMLSYLVYKQVDTEVEIRDYAMHISQKLKKIFSKPRETEESIYLADIEDISIQTKMDFWDTLYGSIFAVLGFFYPIWFLAAAVFLFCGYGKVIKIKKSDGEEFMIPTESNTDDVKQMMSMVKKG